MFTVLNDVLKNRHLKSRPDLFESRYPEIYKEILETTPEDLPWVERIYRYFYHINEDPKCATCGAPVGFRSFTKGYAQYCCPGCVSKNSNIKEQKRQTCINHFGVDNPSKDQSIQQKKIETSQERYGVDNPSKTQMFKDKVHNTKMTRYGDPGYNNIEKIKQTNKERYGVEYFTQTRGFHENAALVKEQRYGDPHYTNMEKFKQTCLQRYGTENPLGNEEIREKVRRTNMERYGVEVPTLNDEIMEKVRRTNLERYGVEYAIGSDVVRGKITNSFLERYGVDNPFSLPEIREKIRETNIRKYGDEYGVRNPEVRKKIGESLKKAWDSKTSEERNRDRIRISKMNRPDDVLSSDIIDNIIIYTCTCPHPECMECNEKTYTIPANIHSNRAHTRVELCTRLFPIQYDRISSTSLELFIHRILDEYNITYETNNRSILNGKELDIYLPDHDLAVECNGVYWHSLKEPPYHHMKWENCRERGVQLLTFWEDQIKLKPSVVKNILLSRLGIYDHKIGARQCGLRQVSSKDSVLFLQDWHLQGPVAGSVRLGLYYEDELVALMVFGRKRTALGNRKHDTWELYRYCCRGGWNVVGGASRLFKSFLTDHPGTEVESFSSNDISDGGLYHTLGFKKVGDQTYSYWYVDKWMQRHHRYDYRKNVLVEKYGVDPTMTEFEITDGMGLLRIYDTGQQKWRFVG